MKKDRLLKEAVEVLKKPHVEKWCDKNLKGRSQADTIKDLLRGIKESKLTVEEALYVIFVVGLQWDVKFEGVP